MLMERLTLKLSFTLSLLQSKRKSKFLGLQNIIELRKTNIESSTRQNKEQFENSVAQKASANFGFTFAKGAKISFEWSIGSSILLAV